MKTEIRFTSIRQLDVLLSLLESILTTELASPARGKELAEAAIETALDRPHGASYDVLRLAPIYEQLVGLYPQELERSAGVLPDAYQESIALKAKKMASAITQKRPKGENAPTASISPADCRYCQAQLTTRLGTYVELLRKRITSTQLASAQEEWELICEQRGWRLLDWQNEDSR